MSGHSKWAQIKRQKGASDIKRGNLFTKLGNAVALAAKSGADPSSNPKLREAIEKAKAQNMPSSTIERAIKRGSGQLGNESLEEIIYEAYGPEGVAFIIKTITDNKNRTSQMLKHIFSKYGGSLAGTGAVTWMLDNNGKWPAPPAGGWRIENENASEDALNKIDKISEELEAMDEVADFDFNLNVNKKN